MEIFSKIEKVEDKEAFILYLKRGEDIFNCGILQENNDDAFDLLDNVKQSISALFYKAYPELSDIKFKTINDIKKLRREIENKQRLLLSINKGESK